jgi:hypothetical protein
VTAARRLVEQYPEGGGELLVCQLDESALAPNAQIVGAIPMFEWIGDEDARIFSY